MPRLIEKKIGFFTNGTTEPVAWLKKEDEEYIVVKNESDATSFYTSGQVWINRAKLAASKAGYTDYTPQLV